METVSLKVTPTRTVSVMRAAGVGLTAAFWSPALPDDLDALSTPITFVDVSLVSLDGRAHSVSLRFFASGDLCYDGQVPPPLQGEQFAYEGLSMAFIGQAQQHPAVGFDEPFNGIIGTV